MLKEIEYSKDEVVERVEWHGDSWVHFCKNNEFYIIHDTMGMYCQDKAKYKPEDQKDA